MTETGSDTQISSSIREYSLESKSQLRKYFFKIKLYVKQALFCHGQWAMHLILLIGPFQCIHLLIKKNKKNNPCLIGLVQKKFRLKLFSALKTKSGRFLVLISIIYTIKCNFNIKNRLKMYNSAKLIHGRITLKLFCHHSCFV